jgi:hypothetical protein
VAGDIKLEGSFLVRPPNNIRFGISEDPKVPHEYRNPLSTDWDWYKTDLVSRFDD